MVFTGIYNSTDISHSRKRAMFTLRQIYECFPKRSWNLDGFVASQNDLMRFYFSRISFYQFLVDLTGFTFWKEERVAWMITFNINFVWKIYIPDFVGSLSSWELGSQHHFLSNYSSLLVSSLFSFLVKYKRSNIKAIVKNTLTSKL